MVLNPRYRGMTAFNSVIGTVVIDNDKMSGLNRYWVTQNGTFIESENKRCKSVNKLRSNLASIMELDIR